MNLKQMLGKVAERYGQKTAIVFGERRLSYAELEESSNKVANTLIKLGVSKGERVAILLPNSPELVAIFFGVVKTGGIAVLLDTKYKVGELASLFDDCQPKALVTESPFLEPLVSILPRFESIKQVINLSSNYEGQFVSYHELLDTGSVLRIDVEIEPEDIAHIAYTSGPTFHPRGVILSHQCLVREAAISSDGFQQTDKDIMMLFALPLHHVFGLVSALLTSVYKGSTVIIVPGTGLSISSFMAAIERERGTMFLGVPYIFALAVDIAEKEGIKNDLSSLRLCASCGAPLPIATIQRFKQHYGFDIFDCWGLTEATCLVTCPPIDGSGELGSVGKALPGWEVKIVDDSGKELPPNQTGEVIVKGLIMKGYYNNPEATAATIKDGWVYTGDTGKVNENGYLFLLGRKKEIIINKGQNIHPSDIEEVLHTHPKVAEAAAVGVPDEMRGEVVKAVISLKDKESITEQEIIRFCREYLADYKVPKQIIFMDSLPKTAAGKIRKEELEKSLLA